jgi:hypothetical protein
MPGGQPAGQYARIVGSTSGFNNFTVGDVVLVKNTTSNDGIYTVNEITNDGTNSYMGLSGPQITDETDESDVDILPISLGGNKLIALGDEDSGLISVWSYNESSNASSGTISESPSIGTSGWSSSAIAPVIGGAVSQFVFTPGQSALRVCDSNLSNNALIKHFSYFNTTQFRSADRIGNKYSVKNGTGAFIGWQEHDNNLSKPVAGRLIGMPDNDEGASDQNPALPHNKEFYGIAENGTTVNIDGHLRRSLNVITSSEIGSYATDGDDNQCKLISVENKDPTSSQQFLKLLPSSLAKVPIGAVIGVSDENGIVDNGTTFQAERMLVRNIDADTNRIYVYRNYGTSVAATIDISANPYLVQYGCGFNYKVSAIPDQGSYPEGTYEFAQSFVYDGNQESLLRTRADFFSTGPQIEAVGNFSKLKIWVGAFGPYPARVTGGRIYIREVDSDSTWALLVDIDLEQGCRTSMDGEFTDWASPAGLSDSDSIPKGCFYSGSQNNPLISTALQLDKYRDINNYYPDIKRNSIGIMGESYQCSTVGGERAWYGNVKLKQRSGSLELFGDRVMYSEYRKYDVIPHLNYFVASEGDAEDIIELKYFANKIFVFKSQSLHIWNVSNGEPGNWFPEQTLKNGGVEHPCSVVDTPYGLVWANRTGCYYYDGRQLHDLTEQKIRDTENSYHGASLPPSWDSFVQSNIYNVNPLVVYSPKDKQVYIMKDPTEGGGSEHLCYIYNFLTKAWTFNNSIFSDGVGYTNPIIDWNNNAVVAYDSSIDTGLNIGTAFDKDEIITATIDQRFTGGADSNWVEYSPSTTLSTYTDIDTSGGSNRLTIRGTSGTTAEGAELPTGNMGTRIASNTYRIDAKLAHAGSDGDMEGVTFSFELGGKVVDIGEINTVIENYTADIDITSATGNLRIYNSADNTTAWYIYAVSVKCITLDLDATAATKIMVGDRLKVDSEEFLVLEVNTDKVTVETAYNSTTAADHSATTDVYAQKANFQQISPASVDNAYPSFITKDFDFDEPGRVKKIYKIYITYMNSSSNVVTNKMKVAADGNTTWAQTSIATPHSGSTFALTGVFASSQSSWNVAIFTFDNPFPCQSISLLFNDAGDSPTASGISINDISFEYRTIHKRVS